tara:strand:+ start:24 stop:1400 length:1377 start_codon:yes stop_codon:yes gene_type:complete
MLRIFIIATMFISAMAESCYKAVDSAHYCWVDNNEYSMYPQIDYPSNINTLDQKKEHAAQECNKLGAVGFFFWETTNSQFASFSGRAFCQYATTQAWCTNIGGTWETLRAADTHSGNVEILYEITCEYCANKNGTVSQDACRCGTNQCSDNEYCYNGVCKDEPVCTDDNDCGGDKPHCVNNFCFGVGNVCTNTDGTAVQDACVCGFNQCSDDQYCYNGDCYQSDPTVPVVHEQCTATFVKKSLYFKPSQVHQNDFEHDGLDVCDRCGGACSVAYHYACAHLRASLDTDCSHYYLFVSPRTCPNGTVANVKRQKFGYSLSQEFYNLFDNRPDEPTVVPPSNVNNVLQKLNAQTTCHLCPAGTYAPDRNGLDRCLRPDPGYIVNSDQSGQVPDSSSCHCPNGTRISEDDAACGGGAVKCAACDTGYTLQGDVCVPSPTFETASATQLKDQFNSKYSCNDQ